MIMMLESVIFGLAEWYAVTPNYTRDSGIQTGTWRTCAEKLQLKLSTAIRLTGHGIMVHERRPPCRPSRMYPIIQHSTPSR